MKRKFKVTIGEKTFTVEVEELTETVPIPPSAKLSIKPPMEEKTLEAPKPLTRAPVSTTGDERVVRTPMPGVVVSIKRKVKDRIKVGDLLLTIEAMKMENEIYAPKSGVIKRIAVSEKQSVNYGDVLVEIG